ncbi:MAG: cytochrome c [Gammaproteobacteria bacterium]|nr:cytochrome c [Gammaproteobacteria bacterium]
MFSLLLSHGLFAVAGMPDQSRQKELRHLLKHDCGSCHGMSLKGGLGPALTIEALAGKAKSYLLRTILDGRPGTPMPPWKGILSEAEATWLVGVLIEGKGSDER